MGIRLQMSPHLFRLMSSEDQARYGVVPDPLSCIRDNTGKTSRKMRLGLIFSRLVCLQLS